MTLKSFAITICIWTNVLAASTNITIHSVGSLRDTGDLQCGSKVTFVCSIPTYKYTMQWLIDSDKVAECVTTNCVQYPPYKVDNIEFSPDTSNGEFNMTINPVSLEADGRKIKCSSGSESDQLQLAVKVLSRRNTTEIVERKDENRNMINITAMTGCVFSSSAISMQWFYFEGDHASKLYSNKMTSANVASKLSVCSSGACGGNVKISSTLSIPDVQNGKEYFFQIAIRHEDTRDIILVNSTRSYKTNDVLTNVKIHSVGSLRDTGSVQCGYKVTFICSIPTYTYNMVWLFDSEKVAECTTTNCVQYTPYNIEFSPDTSNGEFNMTISPVTLKADGRKIKCSFGSEGVQLKLAVKVLPRRNTTEIVETKDENRKMIRITATTGCVFPSSAISMQWYYYEEGQKPKLYKRSSPTEAINFSVCSSENCGGNGVVKMSSTLSLPDGQNGKEFFFQIAIRHEDTGDVIFVNSRHSYKLNEITSEIDKATDLPVVVIIALGTIVASLLLTLTIFKAAKLKRKLVNLRRNNRQPIHSTTKLIVQSIEDTENKNGTDLTETRKASDSVVMILDDPDKTEEKGNICSNALISVFETKDMSRQTEHRNKTDLTETRKASGEEAQLLDDSDKSNEEGNNADSGSNDSTLIYKTKTCKMSRVMRKPT